jgi:glycerol-3-phosphate cytidylyltransferase
MSISTEGTRVVLTYGTFDLFHVGHLNLLTRLRELGDRLIVGVSTDAFNEQKGKQTIVKFQDRFDIVASLKCVDLVVPEESWDQKAGDIRRLGVTVFGIGDDWIGKFDHLKELCEVVYLPRTDHVSSTQLKRLLQVLDRSHVDELKHALDLISSIVERFE